LTADIEGLWRELAELLGRRQIFVQIENAFAAFTPTLNQSFSGLTARGADEAVSLHRAIAPEAAATAIPPAGCRIPDSQFSAPGNTS
jgi:hypothetical protein